MGEYDDMFLDQEDYTPRGVTSLKRRIEELQEKIDQDKWVKPKLMEYRNRLEEAEKLFHEAVDKYPAEEKQDLWTSRVRAWLEKVDERPKQN